MKHLKKFNEATKDDLKDEFLSSFETEGSFKEHEEEIKKDILKYIEELLDEEAESIKQLVKLKKGEISEEEVDLDWLLNIEDKLNRDMMDIVGKYN